MVRAELLFVRLIALLLLPALVFLIGSPKASQADQSSVDLGAGILSVGATISSALDSSAFGGAIQAPEQQEEREIGIDLQFAALELRNLKGEELREFPTRGKKLVLYFWSIYCHSCVDAIKDLEAIRSDLGDKNVELLTVHLFEPSTDKLLARVQQLGISVPVLIAPKEIRDRFSIRLLPTSLVFDGESKLIARFEGELDEAGLRDSLMGDR
jgi:thiol-disulfide isomerase/thioredoxin